MLALTVVLGTFTQQKKKKKKKKNPQGTVYTVWFLYLHNPVNQVRQTPLSTVTDNAVTNCHSDCTTFSSLKQTWRRSSGLLEWKINQMWRPWIQPMTTLDVNYVSHKILLGLIFSSYNLVRYFITNTYNCSSY